MQDLAYILITLSLLPLFVASTILAVVALINR